MLSPHGSQDARPQIQGYITLTVSHSRKERKLQNLWQKYERDEIGLGSRAHFWANYWGGCIMSDWLDLGHMAISEPITMVGRWTLWLARPVPHSYHCIRGLGSGWLNSKCLRWISHWKDRVWCQKNKDAQDIISVQFSCSVVSNSLRPHESQQARPPCSSPSPGVHSNSCPSFRCPEISLWGRTSSIHPCFF